LNHWEPIPREVLRSALDKVISVGRKARDEISNDFMSTGAVAIDPFAAIVSAGLTGNWDAWKKSEIDRQVGKSISNQIGYFHQELLGSVPGWESLPKGAQMPDLICSQRKLFVELKNKFNTVKGSDKIGVYNALVLNEKERYPGWTGAYVYIVENSALSPQVQPVLFTPSDARAKQRAKGKANIVQLTGRLIWAIALDDRPGLPPPPYPRIDAIDQITRMTLDIAKEEFPGFQYPDPALLREFQRSVGGER